MSEQTTAMQTMKISEAKSQLSSLVNQVYRREARVLIEKAGIPVAALVSVADLEQLIRLEQEKAARRKAMEAISAAFEDVPLEEIEAQLNRIATEGPQVDDAEPTRKLA